MKNLVLYFFLLMLGVSFDFIPDTVYKSSEFSETLLDKGFKCFSCKGDGIIAFYLSLVLLPLEIDLFLKE